MGKRDQLYDDGWKLDVVRSTLQCIQKLNYNAHMKLICYKPMLTQLKKKVGQN